MTVQYIELLHRYNEAVNVANDLYEFFNPEQEMTPDIQELFNRLDAINSFIKELPKCQEI
jgi:hypothetical protein